MQVSPALMWSAELLQNTEKLIYPVLGYHLSFSVYT
jgi:hypothetical protein